MGVNWLNIARDNVAYPVKSPSSGMKEAKRGTRPLAE